jgi:hypothetical protein
METPHSEDSDGVNDEVFGPVESECAENFEILGSSILQESWENIGIIEKEVSERMESERMEGSGR